MKEFKLNSRVPDTCKPAEMLTQMYQKSAEVLAFANKIWVIYLKSDNNDL